MQEPGSKLQDWRRRKKKFLQKRTKCDDKKTLLDKPLDRAESAYVTWRGYALLMCSKLFLNPWNVLYNRKYLIVPSILLWIKLFHLRFTHNNIHKNVSCRNQPLHCNTYTRITSRNKIMERPSTVLPNHSWKDKWEFLIVGSSNL